MNRFKRILVESSLRTGESSVFAWADLVARLAGSERIEFIHAWEAIDIPAEVREKYPWLLEPVEESARKRLEGLISTHFPGRAGLDRTISILEGTPLLSVLKHARDGDADLVIVGRNGTAALAERVSRKAPCSVLTVPEGAPATFSRILVPVDFSEHAAYALEVALAFAKGQGLRSITVLHAFAIPPGSHRSWVPESEFVTDLTRHMEDTLDQMLEPYSHRGMVVIPKVVQNDYPPSAVLRCAQEEGHDLLVFGSKGKGAVAASLLGSTAEEILRTATVPVLTVKEKGSGLGLLQALLDG